MSSDLRTLCDALCEGRLSDADAAELERRVTSDAEARRFYIRYAHLHTTLHRTVGGEARLPMIAGEADDPTGPRDGSRGDAAAMARAGRVDVVDASARRWWGGRVAVAAAIVVTIGLAGYAVWSGGASRSGGSTPAHGEPRKLAIDSGAAEFVLVGGASLLMEGPASVVERSAHRVEVEFGTATFVIPPDAGELLVTAGDLTIRHIGTEFTVMRSEQVTEVRVIDGMVGVVRRGEDEEVTVAAGRGLRSTADGVVMIQVDGGGGVVRRPLANAGFDDVDADAPRALPGWTSFGATIADPPNVHRQWSPVVEPRGGHSVAKVFGRFDAEATFTGVYQEFGVEPGMRCVASVWMMHSTGDRLVGGNAAWCKLEFTDADGQTLRHDESDQRLTADSPTDTYIESRVEAIAPADAARVRFVLIFAQDDRQSPGAALFDDASLTLIPPQESPR